MTSRLADRKLLLAVGLIVALGLGSVFYARTVAGSADSSGLPKIRTAPEFSLTDLSGGTAALRDYRGRVVLVNFMFTQCADYCLTLTSILANVQEDLNAEYADDVQFLSISVDPDNDTPEVLGDFAQAMDVDLSNWDFLTGDVAEIDRIASAYGVFFRRTEADYVDHNLLTSIVDRNGIMRVQYMGERFDTDELLADLRALSGGRRQ